MPNLTWCKKVFESFRTEKVWLELLAIRHPVYFIHLNHNTFVLLCLPFGVVTFAFKLITTEQVLAARNHFDFVRFALCLYFLSLLPTLFFIFNEYSRVFPKFITFFYKRVYFKSSILSFSLNSPISVSL